MGDLRCSRCGIDIGNFTGGLDPDEWYCAICADDIPEIALTRSRGAVRTEAFHVLASASDGPPEPPMVFPEFDHLRRVIAVGHRVVVKHLAVTVFSAELFTDGFRIQTRIELEPDHGEYVPDGIPDYDDPDAPHGRMLHLEAGFVITDDLDGRYFCQPLLGGTVNRQEGMLQCAPAIDPDATELLIQADRLRWQDLFRPHRGFFVDNGPWHFRVPLI